MRSVASIVIAVAITTSFSSCDNFSQPRESIFAGIRFVQTGFQLGSLSFSERSSLVSFSLNSYQFEVLVNQRKDSAPNSLKGIAKKAQDFFLVNANFFDEKQEALGLVISRGSLVNDIHHGGDLLNGVLVLYSDGTKIVNRSEFVMAGAIEAVQSGPILLQNGRLTQLDSKRQSVRMAVCLQLVDDTSHLAFFLHVTPISLSDLAKKLLALKCVDALNLDGGGSAQMLFRSGGDELVDFQGVVKVPILIRVRQISSLGTEDKGISEEMGSKKIQ